MENNFIDVDFSAYSMIPKIVFENLPIRRPFDTFVFACVNYPTTQG